MTDRPPITREDFSRLLTERGLKDIDPLEWFEQRGFDQEVPEQLIRSAGQGFMEILVGGILMDEGNPTQVMRDVAATLMLAGFAMGWDAHQQFGTEEPYENECEHKFRDYRDTGIGIVCRDCGAPAPPEVIAHFEEVDD